MVDVEATIPPVKGFRVAGIHAGLKKDNALDFMLLVTDRPCATGGIFTTNTVKAAPVLLSQRHLAAKAGEIRAVAINTASANAATGMAGLANAETVTKWVSEQAQIGAEQVLVMSTGVIGTHLPMEKLQAGVERAYQSLSPDGWSNAAQAIMTTDTRPKLASTTIFTSDGQYTIAGIAKGAGMIAPNMATMLSVIITDARMNPAQAQSLLTGAAQKSYNRIVVDGDTSTNDTVFLLASGASGVTLNSPTEMLQFQEALVAVCQKLAQDVVRDGEGATKFITIDVFNASSDEAAHKIANTIASSPLVKTAFFGNDANWGRIVAAAGRSGAAFDPDTAKLWISPGEELFEEDRGLLIFEAGTPTSYSEKEATGIISEETVYISLDCGAGQGQATVWTCDLSHDYVDINGSYRT
jgi:glutamate N-acetyltransferase/amino-acid N-acetyltransferase